MMDIANLAVGNLFRQILLLHFQHFPCVLCLPLKRCEGFGDKAGNADRDLRRSCLVSIGIFIIRIHYALGKSRDPVKVAQLFGGQSHHKIELDLVFAGIKSDIDRTKKILLAHVFIDNITKPLRSRLGSKSKRGRTNARHLIHQFLGKAVYTERRQGQADHIFIRPGKQFVGKRPKLGVIAYGERGERNFFVTRRFIEASRLLVQHLRSFFTNGTVNHTCLTEAATANTTAINLQHDAIVDRFNIRHDHLIRKIRLVHVFHDTLGHFCRNVVIYRGICFYGIVLVIADLIEGRYIGAPHRLCCFVKKRTF